MNSIKIISFDLLDTLFDPRHAAPKLYPDVQALLELKRFGRLGIITPPSHQHLQHLQEQLRVAVDFYVAEAPTPEALCAIALKTMQERFQGAAENWLHVSAKPERDLLPAKALGAQTCFIPRPHLSNAYEADSIKPTVAVSDLFQLHEGIRAESGSARAWTLKLNAPHPKLIREFMRWLRQEGRLPQYPGLNVQVYRSTPEALELRFVGPPAGDERLDRLLAAFFSALAETFPTGLLSQSLETGDVILES